MLLGIGGSAGVACLSANLGRSRATGAHVSAGAIDSAVMLHRHTNKNDLHYITIAQLSSSPRGTRLCASVTYFSGLQHGRSERCAYCICRPALRQAALPRLKAGSGPSSGAPDGRAHRRFSMRASPGVYARSRQLQARSAGAWGLPSCAGGPFFVGFATSLRGLQQDLLRRFRGRARSVARGRADPGLPSAGRRGWRALPPASAGFLPSRWPAAGGGRGR